MSKLHYILVALMVPALAGAQIGRSRASSDPQPDYWVGLSYGFIDGVTINDGNTGSTWNFGYTSAIRATFEKQLQRGFTGGISASFANAPLNYSGLDCFSCEATADISQYMAFIHGGGGRGFHGIYNLEAGFTEFSNFRENSTNLQLAPTDAQYDFSFGFGGGIGYGFSSTTEGYAGEMFDWVLAPQGTNVASSAPRLMTFRAGFRVGF